MMEIAVTSAFEKLQGQLDFALPFQTSLDMDESITSNQYVANGLFPLDWTVPEPSLAPETPLHSGLACYMPW
jgi:hypothetical protein